MEKNRPPRVWLSVALATLLSLLPRTRLSLRHSLFTIPHSLFLLSLLALPLHAQTKPADYDWPQWRGPNRDGVSNATNLVDKFDGPDIKIRWRVPVSNGYSGPTVADGRVYLTDRIAKPIPQERILCFNWQTGETLWKVEYPCTYGKLSYPDGPRAAVTVHNGLAYALGATGHLHCLDAKTGKPLWDHDTQKEYTLNLPIWGIASAPLVEDDLVIIQIGGADDASIVAFDTATGKERWHALKDKTAYSSPIIIEQAGKRVLVCWTADRVVGLDPRTGNLHWQAPFPQKQIIGIATPVKSGNRLFVTSFYQGSLMLQLDPDKLEARQLWQRRGESEKKTDALHSIISTPLFLGDYVYGVDSYGELRCLDANTGDRLWEDKTAVPTARWATIHFIQNHDRTLMLNERGQLILATLDPKGFHEISRAQLLKPTLGQLAERNGVCWSPPALAYSHIFARNDEELICASLEKQ